MRRESRVSDFSWTSVSDTALYTAISLTSHGHYLVSPRRTSFRKVKGQPIPYLVIFCDSLIFVPDSKYL